jgi:signal transduction histidine kinase
VTHQNQIVEGDSPILSQEILGALVRRHTHDLRNFLNGMELELALLTEIADETERAAALKRIRREMKHAEAMIRSFGAKFIVETKSPVCASDVAEQWMSDARGLLPECSITWDIQAGHALLHVEAALLRSVLCDLLGLTARTCPRLPLEAGCASAEDRVIFRVSCPEAQTESGYRDPHEQLLWASLRCFVSRNDGRLECATPPVPGPFWCRLILPTARL